MHEIHHTRNATLSAHTHTCRITHAFQLTLPLAHYPPLSHAILPPPLPSFLLQLLQPGKSTRLRGACHRPPSRRRRRCPLPPPAPCPSHCPSDSPGQGGDHHHQQPHPTGAARHRGSHARSETHICTSSRVYIRRRWTQLCRYEDTSELLAHVWASQWPTLCLHILLHRPVSTLTLLYRVRPQGTRR